MYANNAGEAHHIQPADRQWERVGDRTQRMRVDGGWLYKVESYSGHVSLQFVPVSQVVDDYTARSYLKG